MGSGVRSADSASVVALGCASRCLRLGGAVFESADDAWQLAALGRQKAEGWGGGESER